ncbi:hypothetical protein EC973_000849 [Apophysomyces ossiformis]|uniref:Uncharacterized protein n=1 Tax=Apophysomyces ossiformis TaxID=679940 RepID=A0A8H7EMT8_9FUNG|nr:hypothetical protein EC973_000849 [Apophysomyces ossiformis]
MRINYHFGIKQLYGQVIPEKTKIKFKKSQIVISLSKYEYGRNWPDIRLKKSNDMYHDIKRADRRSKDLERTMHYLRLTHQLAFPDDSSKDASTEALKAAMENVIEANDEQSKQLKKTIANAQQRVLNDMNLFVVPERKDQH